MIASVAFLIVLSLLVAFFALKHYETNTGMVWCARQRKVADERVVTLRAWTLSHADLLETLPSIAARFLRYLVHEMALLVAYGARRIETWAHDLADFVSHKHSHQARETRSDFLKQVSEHRVDTPNSPSEE